MGDLHQPSKALGNRAAGQRDKGQLRSNHGHSRPSYLHRHPSRSPVKWRDQTSKLLVQQ
jgi:hypothetical protein